MTYQKPMVDSNAEFLERIDQRKQHYSNREYERIRERKTDIQKEMEKQRYFYSSMKVKKQMRAEAMSQSLRRFGFR